MMKKVLFISFFFLAAIVFISNQSYAQDPWTGNANFLIGSKALDKDDWEPVESQTELGVDVDFAPRSWPIHLAVGFLQSSDDAKLFDDYGDYKFRVTTSELKFGIKKIWDAAPMMHPYVGGGLAMINAKAKLSEIGYGSTSDDDQAIGLYVNGGIFWTLASYLNLGFELGYSKATVDVYDVDAEAGGGHALFLVGFHW